MGQQMVFDTRKNLLSTRFNKAVLAVCVCVCELITRSVEVRKKKRGHDQRTEMGKGEEEEEGEEARAFCWPTLNYLDILLMMLRGVLPVHVKPSPW